MQHAAANMTNDDISLHGSIRTLDIDPFLMTFIYRSYKEKTVNSELVLNVFVKSLFSVTVFRI